MSEPSVELCALLQASVKNGTPGLKVQSVRPIASRELEALEEARLEVHRFQAHQAVFEMCGVNRKELFDYHSRLERAWDKDKSGRRPPSTCLDEMNRLLSNYLAAVRQFLDYTDCRLKRESAAARQTFTNATAHEFDQVFAYRFFYHLRNYVTHRGLPIGGASFGKATGDSGKHSSTVKFSFDRDTLLADHHWHANVKEDLAKMEPQIPVIDLVASHWSCMERLDQALRGHEKERYSKHVIRMWGLLLEVHKKFPGAHPTICEFQVSSDGQVNINQRNLPLQGLQRFDTRVLGMATPRLRDADPRTEDWPPSAC